LSVARDVFISYSQPDQACAYELVERVEGAGIECWVAPRDIAPSADWAAEIIDAISSARTMILVFSANSNESSQVRREVERAVYKGLSILPFRIENVPPSKSLEYFLSSQHWMDAFPPPREPHYARLCVHLKSQLGVQGAPPAVTAPLHVAAPAGVMARAPIFDPAEVLLIERQLAGFIGPLAKHLVKQAALRAAGVDDLVSRLATELDSESDRREFIRRCRTGRSA
jgi:TIR domain